ncbi:hypothetical protein [Paracoccus sp. Ld10]|uniref:hypothetical protein n=1 Tax=Paracoccus sp. Ld10 TaxID=649158 RepID=UPI00386ECC10
MGWCPVGYVSIVELREQCEIVASLIVREMQETADIFSDVKTDPETAAISKWDLDLVVHGKLIENFLHLNACKATACSPDGKLFKLTRTLMRPPIYNHWYSYDERFARHPDLLYVDIWDGVVDLQGVAKRMSEWTDLADGETWQNRAISRFSHLDGWSVCFCADEVNISRDGIHKLWTPNSPIKAPTVGRPLIALDAAKRYLALYPNGHEGQSKKWKQIEDEIGVNQKTIKAGLAKLAEKTSKE